MDRRGFLGRLVGFGSVGVAGCVTPLSRRGPRPNDAPATPGNPTRGAGDRQQHRSRVYSRDPATVADGWGLDEVVDLGGLGAGDGTPIDGLLERHATDGSLLYLPAGDYRIEGTFTVADAGRIGVLGDGATIRPPDGFDDPLLGFGYPEPLTGLYVRGLTFDFRAENTGGRPILGVADEIVVLRDVSVRGMSDVPEDLVRLDVTSPDGVGVVDRLSLPDGSTVPGVTGCEVGDNSRGDVSFYDCHVAGFPDNGLYADPPEGAIGVYGGDYRNNGVANVRITTPDPSVVRGVRVRCDEDDAVGENMRGIRLRGGSGHVVEDCTVEMAAVTSSDGAITFASELESATVRNCRLHVDADGVNAIRVKTPNRGAGEATRNGPFRFENVCITGSAAGGAAVDLSDRRNCSLRNVDIQQSGDDRDGIVTSNVEGEFVDLCVAVTNDALSLSESEIERRNVRVKRATTAERCCHEPGPYPGGYPGE
jgi:hypothetical protein